MAATMTACLLLALVALGASSPEACDSGTCTNPSTDSPVAGSSMIQKVDVAQRQLTAPDLMEEDELMEEASDDELIALAEKVEQWQEHADKCKGCQKGCMVHGKCYTQDPSGKPVTEAICLHYNSTWCDSAPTCSACTDGCIVKGQCYHKTPWGKSVSEGVCKKFRGQWCGKSTPMTCETCKDGCIAMGACHHKTPHGKRATEQICMFHGGKWCGQKATCDACSDGCLVMGKCYTKKHLPGNGKHMTVEKAMKICTKAGGTLCPAAASTIQTGETEEHETEEDVMKDVAKEDVAEEAELMEEPSKDEVLALAEKAEELQERADQCKGCTKGCMVHGKCYKQGPSGEPVTEGVCLRYNGTWCESSPTCSSCTDGCVVKGQCYHKVPGGKSATEGMCKKFRGEWCGKSAPLTCDACKDGCIAQGVCHHKTPGGKQATQQICMYHGGKWCGQKVTCSTCNDGCIVMGKCYTKKHLPGNGKPVTAEMAKKMCTKFGGTLCSAAATP